MKNLVSDHSRVKIITNVLVFLIALIGVSRKDYKIDDISFFNKVIIETFAPIQAGTLSVKEQIEYFFRHYVFIIEASKENDELKARVSELKNQIFHLEEVEKENERMKQLLQFGEDIPRKKVLAQVVGWDASNEFKVLRINKGKSDGLSLLSPVITMNGLVGYIYRLANNYADILTILDQNNRVDSIVARTRSHGVVEGTSRSKCRLKYVVRTDQVKVGDEVLTAGLGNVYPKGIKVGSITEIDKEDFGITQAIELTPSVDFHKLEEVLVLLDGENHQEIWSKEQVDEI